MCKWGRYYIGLDRRAGLGGLLKILKINFLPILLQFGWNVFSYEFVD